jgi:hypothetical protein
MTEYHQIIHHSSKADDWGTPVSILNPVRTVLGQIDLDPASSVEANKLVQARRILTKEDDSLTNFHLWGTSPITAWLNPPGSAKTNVSPTRSMSAAYWWRLMQLREKGLLKHAIFLGFSLSICKTTQGLNVPSVNKFPVCFLRDRIKFIDPRDANKKAPTNDNIMVYVPGTTDRTDKFCEVFEEMGEIRRSR